MKWKREKREKREIEGDNVRGSWETSGIERIDGLDEPPCLILGYCPYGPMVEVMPVDEFDMTNSCPVFAHACPAFSVSEIMNDEWFAKIVAKWPYQTGLVPDDSS